MDSGQDIVISPGDTNIKKREDLLEKLRVWLGRTGKIKEITSLANK